MPRLRDCQLTVYGEEARVLVERRVVIPALPEKSLLERIYRESLDGKPVRYAVAREERAVRALYLAEDLVPRGGHRFGGRKGRLGRWTTSAVQVGGGIAGRLFVGPELFFRQIDLLPDESWLAPLLMGFAADVEVQHRDLADGGAWEWEIRDERFFFVNRGARWSLYGAGNTPTDRFERAIADAKPTTTSDLLWAVGSVSIARQRSRPSLQGL